MKFRLPNFVSSVAGRVRLALGRDDRSKHARESMQRIIEGYNEAYKMGRLTRATRGHNPLARSGDSAVFESADLMHRRTRDLYLNNALIKRVVDALRDLVIGSGINTFADPVDFSFGWNLKKRESDLPRAFDYMLESDEKFQTWATNPQWCDVEQKIDFLEMQSLGFADVVQVGTVLLIEYERAIGGSPVPLCYQVIEQEQIDVRQSFKPVTAGGRLVNGFEYDQDGRETGVWIFDSHPGDHDGGYYRSSADQIQIGGGGLYSSRFVPAAQYHHIYKKTRPSQNTGATWLHAMGQGSVDRDKFVEAELRSAAKAALLCLYAKLKDAGSGGMGFTPDDGAQGNDIALSTSPIATELQPGEEIGVVESARPNSDANNFFDILEHELAGATGGLSYYTMTGRYTKTNYGGFKGALNFENAQIQIIQDAIGKKICLPVRSRWNDLAAAVGYFKNISAREIVAERSRFQRYDVIGPGRALLDADREGSGDLTDLRAGLSTLKIKCARRGLHWLVVLRQAALEVQATGALGLVLDHSAGGGSAIGRDTRRAIDDAIENAIESMGV